MSINVVKEYLINNGFTGEVIILDTSTATVELAAKALKCAEGQIAKSIALLVDNNCVLVCAAGDVKIDNAKFKNYFKVKPRFISHDEVCKYTNHEVGGVCPFALPDNVLVYLDVSLKKFAYVYPACGSSDSMICIGVDKLYEISKSQNWIDVCKEKINV